MNSSLKFRSVPEVVAVVLIAVSVACIVFAGIAAKILSLSFVAASTAILLRAQSSSAQLDIEEHRTDADVAKASIGHDRAELSKMQTALTKMTIENKELYQRLESARRETGGMF